ncbi:Y-family DNA polymerase [Atopobacter phocae]|uniref:Y-family DNA polymerase n=1 Tax=Atopobacter phocae TaxID=136492 RepID=UPI000470083E|nr:Y-family DNA polymerase [Atopobacter phocae]
MSLIDYRREPRADIAFFDIKSFYASVECVERGLHPLTTSLCVMSRADNSKGLILASSPTFKRVFGRNNVGRAYDLPFDIDTRRFRPHIARQQGIQMTPAYIRWIETWAKRTVIVPPRMGLYIERNMAIQHVLKRYAPASDILPYSIDEGFIDLTQSLNYFVPDQSLSRRKRLDLVSSHLQQAIWTETGVYATVGMSNANPLLAKLALDNEAKNTPTMRANWSYEDVPTKVWQLPQLTDFWGIGARTAKRLNKLGIYTVKELAHANPDRLKKEFGVIGVQLFFHANGVDESKVSEPYRPKGNGLGNSQILPKDYVDQRGIELVLAEMAEQVAIRLRKRHRKTTNVAIHVGYSRDEEKRGLRASRKVDPTQNTKELIQHVLALFRQKYDGGAVRRISVRYSGLVDESYTVFTLFDDVEAIDRANHLDRTVDQIREKYGYLALQKATALCEDSRSIARSRLIGGHSAGGLDGLE